MQNPLRDVQRNGPVCQCQMCLGEVYREETMYEWEGKLICSDCFQDVIWVFVKAHPEELASELGIEMQHM